MKRYALLALASALVLLAAPARGAEPRPNILFIIVDDYGWRDLTCYGSKFYETPNMDRLASEGLRFTDAYVAFPRCVPSRFSIMTGKYPARNGGTTGMKIHAPEVTMGRAFQEGGYTTFFCGKWHLGEGASAPDNQGFTINIAGGAAGATRSHFAPYTKARGHAEGEKALIHGLDDAPRDEYLADCLTDETIKFLRTHTSQPFLAVLAHYAVHTPIEGKKEYAAHYRQKLKQNPPPAGPNWEKESAGQNKLKQDHPVYAAMIQSVDEGIGRILDALKQLKLEDRTIVVLTSDNGGLSSRGGTRPMATSNLPLRAGKGHLYEGGTRVPLMVRWPGVTKPGTTTDTPVIATDYYPTFLEMAGLPARPQQHLDGVSFVPLLKEGKADLDRPLFWHNPAPRPQSTADLYSSAVRCGRYKLVDFYTEHRVELYDLETDLGERHNLMASLPDKGKELLNKLDAWRKEVKAAMEPPVKAAAGSRKKAAESSE